MRRFISNSAAFVLFAVFVLAGALPSTAETARQSANRLKGEIQDKTIMTHSRGHGTQVTYHSRNGRSYLWYPGNQTILRGQYKFEAQTLPLTDAPDSPKATIVMQCYKYGAGTHNPVTGSSGGGWSCMPAVLAVDEIVGVMNGDSFGLSGHGAVPFKLSKSKTTMQRLHTKFVQMSGQ